MKFRTPVLLLALIFLCASCNKNPNSADGQQLVYFDYAYVIPGNSGHDGHSSIVNKRVCYDIGAGQTVWESVNTKYPGMYYMDTYQFGSSLNYYNYDVQNQYNFNKLVNNSLIRVFADQDYPIDYISPLTSSTYNGVYFQKIDAATGT